MSSTIKLYEHNQKAYDALLDMLGERDRACVIKPTGTGKFVILAKMVQDNPDKRFLLLGTNDYMFNDQMANLAEIAPGFTPENLQFMTYSAAMMAARRGEEISGYDVVVADEFHHCGAEEWGKGVAHILDADGVTEDRQGMIPDDATVEYISTLDGSREERAFELAKRDYYGFLDYKEDRYTTVYGYMD